MKKIVYIFILGLAFSTNSFAQEKTKEMITKEIQAQENTTKDLQTISGSISNMTEDQKLQLSNLLTKRSAALQKATTDEEKKNLKQGFGSKILSILTKEQRAEFEKNTVAYKKLVKGL